MASLTHRVAICFLSMTVSMALKPVRLGRQNTHCQQILGTLSDRNEGEMFELCLRSTFSEAACLNAKDVLAGRAMSPALAKPVCAALLGTNAQSAKGQPHGIALAE